MAAGVYTKNLVYAAPVALDRERTPGTGFRVVAINSGNANACTGDRGFADALEMARLGRGNLRGRGGNALVMSTGVIGEFLPLEKIAAGLQTLGKQLGSDEKSLIAAARGMMTTDTVHKLAGRHLKLERTRDADHRHGQGGRDDRAANGDDARARDDRRPADARDSPSGALAPSSTIRSIASASKGT